MILPEGLMDAHAVALEMEISDSKFLRLHAKAIPHIQVHNRGPRIYRIEDVSQYLSQINQDTTKESE